MRYAASIALVALLLLLHGAGAALAQSRGQPPLDEAFDKGTLIIVADEHACHLFDIYLAVTQEQKRRGLMFVRDLPETSGMLFFYDLDARHSMWMKNTFIPLDILFIRSDGGVSSIARDTEPQSLRSIGATEPVRFVLELNAGVTERLSIGTDSYIVID